MKDREAALAKRLSDELFRISMLPFRGIAEEMQRTMESRFTGDDADLKGTIRETHIIFGMACAREAAEELNEYRELFDIRWKADMHAIKRWQEAHPGNDLTWPDHADLVVWLIGQLGKQGASPPDNDTEGNAS